MTDQERQELLEWSARVMGLKRVYADGIPMWQLPNGRWDVIKWYPDKDINQAIMVVQEMRKLELMQFYLHQNALGEWSAEFDNYDIKPSIRIADHPALAIILAAKATGIIR